jgi:flagellar motor component MotA
MYKGVDEYLDQLKQELKGSDPALIQDALSDAEEFLRTALMNIQKEDPRLSEEEQQKSGYFWEAAVRNFWMMGVLGSVISFVIALGNSEGGIFEIATRMSASYLSAVYGMILAVICSFIGHLFL